MEIRRMITIDNPMYFMPGDKIRVGHYTATCQEITNQGAIFLLDRYLDEPMQMYDKDANQGGYEKSDLRKALQSDEVLQLFADIRDNMVPFKNGDLLRIPFAGEMFGSNIPEWVEPDGHEQWPLMGDPYNRLTMLKGESDQGWLQNKVNDSSLEFCSVDSDGLVDSWRSPNSLGVRPVFMLKAGDAREFTGKAEKPTTNKDKK